MAHKGPSLGNTLKEITECVARQKAKGAPVERIVHGLVERGWPEKSARQFVMNVEAQRPPQDEPDERRVLARQYQWCALRGIVCVIIGVAIVVMGLSSSDAYHGLYYFTMGILLCIFETIDFLSGLSGWWGRRD